MNSFEVGKGIDEMKSRLLKAQVLAENCGYADIHEMLSAQQKRLTECLLKMSAEASDSVHECHIERYGRKGSGNLSVIIDDLRSIVTDIHSVYSTVYRDYLNNSPSPKILKILPVPDYQSYPVIIAPTPPGMTI